jgi:hypothetical protein
MDFSLSIFIFHFFPIAQSYLNEVGKDLLLWLGLCQMLELQCHQQIWQVVFNILEVTTFNSYSGIKNIITGVPQNRNLLPALYNVFIILLKKKYQIY